MGAGGFGVGLAIAEKSLCLECFNEGIVYIHRYIQSYNKAISVITNQLYSF